MSNSIKIPYETDEVKMLEQMYYAKAKAQGVEPPAIIIKTAEFFRAEIAALPKSASVPKPASAKPAGEMQSAAERQRLRESTWLNLG